MTHAVVDTTILADATLKVGPKAAVARAALRRYTRTSLPVYAIKEFHAGPLQNYVWIHNKFVRVGTYAGTLKALHSMAMTPRRYTTATAIEALETVAQSFTRLVPGDLPEKYGRDANLDDCLRDHFRLSLRRVIMRAWRKRRAVTSQVVGDAPCYPEKDPTVGTDGLILLEGYRCPKRVDCGVCSAFRTRTDDLGKLLKVLPADGGTREQTRRRKALREIKRFPKRPVHEGLCRSLGDAVFVLLAQPGSVVLTTNARDFEPLANALGLDVETP